MRRSDAQRHVLLRLSSVVQVLVCLLLFSSQSLARDYKGETVIVPFLGLGLPVGDFARSTDNLGGDANPGLGFGIGLEYYPKERFGLGLLYVNQRLGMDEQSSKISGSHYSHSAFGGYVRLLVPSDLESVKFTFRGGVTYGELSIAGESSGGYEARISLDAGLGAHFMVTDQAAISLEIYGVHVPMSNERRIVDGTIAPRVSGYNGQWLGLRFGFPIFPFASGS